MQHFLRVPFVTFCLTNVADVLTGLNSSIGGSVDVAGIVFSADKLCSS